MSSDSEHDMWKRSDTEEDVWSDRESGWPVHGVVGEEIDTFGETRYEIRWDEWERQSDGTNTTWMKDMPDRPDLMKTWKQRQRARRWELASESLDIDPRLEIGVNMPYTNTILRSQAYEEKLDKRRNKRGYGDFVGWDIEVEENRRRMLALDDGNTGNAKRRSLRDSTIRQQTVSSKQSSTNLRTSSISTVDRLTPKPQPSPTTSSSSSLARPPRPLPQSARSENSNSGSAKLKRVELWKEWTAAAKKVGAAAVYIVNTRDDEANPSLPDGFQYCESHYMHDNDICHTEDAALFVTCDCVECTDATKCSCQQISELVDASKTQVFAYTTDGLFQFNVEKGIEVIECNQHCSCDKTCPNRIAQRPRTVPIEIFKTKSKGWGVRATKNIKRGKVMGIYTGKLIRRDDVEKLPEEEKDYCFDLDGRENDKNENGGERYTVSSYTCGNWTRFLNHSCDPNMQVYTVLYDTIPESSKPYLAFVATRDIPEREELTFEYDPAAAPIQSKGKKKLKIPEGMRRCGCGAETCREWVWI